MLSIPIVSKISCGNGSITYEKVEDYEPTPEAWVHGGEYFYLRAEDDSMMIEADELWNLALEYPYRK
jgi:repressor LexA